MRKNIALIALLLASLALTGCREGSAAALSEASVITSEAQSEAVSAASEPAEFSLSKAECAQIVALLKAWGDLDYNIHPDQTDTRRDDYFPECVDASRFITEEITPRGSTRSYTEYFYLISSGDFSTETGFSEKLDEMFTEGFKTRYFESTAGQMFRFRDGEVYVAGFGWTGRLTAPDVVTLDIEENGGTITITATGADNEQYTAELARTEGGLRVADVGDGALFGLPSLFRHKVMAVDVYVGGELVLKV